jgi:DNA-binding IclR family transcriptional regulator
MKIQSVHRAIDILCLFETYRPSLSLTQIAKRLDLNKGTAYGLIKSLEKNNFLRQNSHTKHYKLGPKLYELGLIFTSTLGINQISSGPAHELAEKTQQTPRIAVLEGDYAFITLYASPGAQTNISGRIGPKLPLYCTAIGKALLAFGEPEFIENYFSRIKLVKYTENTNTDPEKLHQELKETIERGYAAGQGGFIKGRAGIAAPIRGYENKLEGAIAISGRAEEIMGKKMDWYIEEVLSTAANISSNMGYSPFT